MKWCKSNLTNHRIVNHPFVNALTIALPDRRLLPISKELRQRSVPLGDEGFGKLVDRFGERYPATPHLWSSGLSASVDGYEAIGMGLRQDQPAIIP